MVPSSAPSVPSARRDKNSDTDNNQRERERERKCKEGAKKCAERKRERETEGRKERARERQTDLALCEGTSVEVTAASCPWERRNVRAPVVTCVLRACVRE